MVILPDFPADVGMAADSMNMISHGVPVKHIEYNISFNESLLLECTLIRPHVRVAFNPGIKNPSQSFTEYHSQSFLCSHFNVLRLFYVLMYSRCTLISLITFEGKDLENKKLGNKCSYVWGCS